MKSLRKFCAALVLTLAIAVPTFSGDISCPGQSTPPPPPPDSQGCVAGDISCPGARAEGTPDVSDVPAEAALDPITELTLSVIRNLLSFF